MFIATFRDGMSIRVPVLEIVMSAEGLTRHDQRIVEAHVVVRVKSWATFRGKYMRKKR